MDKQGCDNDAFSFTVTRSSSKKKEWGTVSSNSSTLNIVDKVEKQCDNISQVSEVIKVKEKRNWKISNEAIVWSVFWLLTILCVVDRFVMKGDAVLERNGKRVSKLWGENIGETLTNVVWALTARLIITSQNLMFYTSLWCIPNMLAEMAPSFISIKGIRDVHLKIHRIAGVFLIGLPSLIHVLVIFIPPIVDQTKLTYHPPSEFNYSQQLGHLNWTKFYDPAAVENWAFNDKYGVHLTSDEIYRLTLMIVLFCVIFPLTRSNLLNKRSYSLAIALHGIAGVWYAVDNIRKITHGLAHVFNLPLLIIWCLDRFLSIVIYRKNQGKVVKKWQLGYNSYIDIRVKMNNRHHCGIGDIYYLLESPNGCNPERSHPFTLYSNHSLDNSWDVGVIVAVMEDDKQWASSWTRNVCQTSQLQESFYMKCWGPYRSAVMDLYTKLQNNEQSSYLLFASGSGFGYLLDVLGVLAFKGNSINRKEKPVIDIHFTARGKQFYQRFNNEVENMLRLIKLNGSATIMFTWYNTDSSDGQPFTAGFSHYVQDRINFNKIINSTSKKSVVYFVGRPSLAEHIENICSRNNVEFVQDFTNGEKGKSDKEALKVYVKRAFYGMTATVFLCMMLSIYFRVHSLAPLKL